MRTFSKLILASVTAVGAAGAFALVPAWAQDSRAQDSMAPLATKTIAAPWASPNQEVGQRLNPVGDDSSRFATLTDKPQQPATFSTASEDAGLNPGFPAATPSAPPAGDVPGADTSFSVGGFGREGASTAPSRTPPEPRSVEQAATVTLGFETASAEGLSVGMPPNTVRLGQ